MHLFINPGHAPNGEPDPGAIAADGTEEWELNRTMAAQIMAACQVQGHVVTCVQSDSLEEVVTRANASGADYFLSVHTNASAYMSAFGAEVYIHPHAGEITRRWAECIAQGAMRAGYELRQGDGSLYKTANFYVLRRTVMPAVLLEAGFITNPGDRSDLRGLGPQRWARIISDALLCSDSLRNERHRKISGKEEVQ